MALEVQGRREDGLPQTSQKDQGTTAKFGNISGTVGSFALRADKLETVGTCSGVQAACLGSEEPWCLDDDLQAYCCCWAQGGESGIKVRGEYRRSKRADTCTSKRLELLP